MLGIHFGDDLETALVPQADDYLLYDIEASLLEYHRPGGKRIVWHHGDNKIILHKVTPDGLTAIGETIGGVFQSLRSNR